MYKKIDPPQLVIGADGGANQLDKLGLKADVVVGDMDSIDQKVLKRLQLQGAQILTYPREKDDTDTQLALQAALERGATRITVLGGTGDRLDHTWSSILSTLPLLYQGVKIRFFHPRQSVYVINDQLNLAGQPGDTISLLALQQAAGVSISGVKYPLHEVELLMERPYAVSNEMIGDQALIEIKSGVLMVVHITT